MTEEEAFDRYVSPFRRNFLKSLGYDIKWTRGEGAYLWNDAGERFLDLCGGYAVFSLGRFHPRIAQTVRDVLDQKPATLVQLDTPAGAGLLARELVSLAPKPLSRALFCNSGTEAIEAAMKLSRKATGRTKFVYCDGSFHGLTTGALSTLGYSPLFREGFGQLLPSEQIPLNDLDALRTVLGRGDCAGFLIEPLQGRSMQPASDEFLRGARDICTATGTMLIVDEVQSGLGRTGTMFAFEQSGIAPDILTLSKALSGGVIPIGAVLHTDEIHYKVFAPETWWVHSSTFKENAIATSVALAVLKELQQGEYLARVRWLNERIHALVDPVIAKHDRLEPIRGRGLMLAIGIRGAEEDVEKNVVGRMLREEKVFLQPRGWIKLTPPFVITEDDIANFAGALDRVMTTWKPRD